MQEILPFLKNLRALDLVDILAVSFIVYRMLLIVQGTRAVQMLLGLGPWPPFGGELIPTNSMR